VDPADRLKAADRPWSSPPVLVDLSSYRYLRFPQLAVLATDWRFRIRLTLKPSDAAVRSIRGIRFDPIAAVLFAVGVLSLYWVSRLDFLRQDANWDLLNYHAYLPSSVLAGTWLNDGHPASIASYLTPYQDLLWWPVISGVPAPIATAVIVAVQVSIFIPLGLIVQTVVPALSRSRALAVGLIGICGSMMMTELGVTMGDVLPAILTAWAVYLLLSVLSGQALRPERRAVLAGALVGAAVALKYTSVIWAPGLLVVAILVAVAGKRRSAVLFLVTSAVAGIVLISPWALVLQINLGSPVFPLYNSIFQAPRYPAVDFHDTEFLVRSFADLVLLPIRLALGTAHTAEMRFHDARWAVAGFAAGVGIVVAALRSWRPVVRNHWRVAPPSLALIGFWGVSYVVWALEFGIQRYAMILEVLALPVIVAGACLALPRLRASRASLPMLILLAIFLARTTSIIDFGRRPMGWAPLMPAATIEPLTRYDAIVIGERPLAFLRAVNRNAPGSNNQIWMEQPFNDADRIAEEQSLAGRSIGVVFYVDRHATAATSAASLCLRINDDCVTFDSPLANSDLESRIELCSASPLP
jgi:hypothetical protein